MPPPPGLPPGPPGPPGPSPLMAVGATLAAVPVWKFKGVAIWFCLCITGPNIGPEKGNGVGVGATAALEFAGMVMVELPAPLCPSPRANLCNLVSTGVSLAPNRCETLFKN